jgi:osmoprotectant transport system ATP-binding protein
MQNSALLPHRTVADNIATVPRLEGTSRRDAHGRALELMDLVGLDRGLAERYPAQRLGGQQQRVGVARGLAGRPNILLMDEPFGAVDPLVRADQQHELAAPGRLGKTIIFVTQRHRRGLHPRPPGGPPPHRRHDRQRGTPAEILADPADQFVADFIGLEPCTAPLPPRDHPAGPPW